MPKSSVPVEEHAAALELDNVSVTFDGTRVLHHLNLRVTSGECLVICGPSGSGKSTAVRCANGLVLCEAGQVRINGEPLSAANLATMRRRVGMVFQQFNLFPHLSVLENCCIGPVHVLKHTTREAHARALEYLERVHLRAFADRYPAQLSGGQQQRVAIARALTMEPEMMLYDEPTSALDPEMIKEVLDVISELVQDGMTTVCVTHEMGFARHVADRIAFLECGTLLHEASPDAFFSAPPSARVREFLGNVLSVAGAPQ